MANKNPTPRVPAGAVPESAPPSLTVPNFEDPPASACGYLHESMMLGTMQPAVVFDRSAGAMSLIAYAHGQLRVLTDLMSFMLDANPAAEAVLTLAKPAIDALHEAAEVIQAAERIA